MKVKLPIALAVIACITFAGLSAGSGDSKTVVHATPVVWEQQKKTEEIVRWNSTIKLNNTLRLNYVVASNYAAAIEVVRAEEAEAASAAMARRVALIRKAASRQSVGSTSTSTPTGGGGSGSSTVGGACGGATNGADRFIGAESGGNPNSRNSSGAWGCYQIMPGTWQSSCRDLGVHGSAGTEAQADCASRLPSSSWAATGG